MEGRWKIPDALTVSTLAAASTAAAINPRLWGNFLDELGHAVGPISTHILKFGPESDAVGEITSGYDPSYIETYTAHYARINAWAPGFLKHQVGEVVDSRQMCSDNQLFQTEWYNDWILPQGDISLGGGQIIARGPDGVFVIGGNIPRRAGQPLLDEWMSLLAILTKQLRNAWDISRTMMSCRLGGQEAAVIVVRPDRGIVFLNDSASSYASDGHVLGLDAKGRLRGATRELDQWFEILLKRLGSSILGDDKLRIKRSKGKDLTLHATAVNSDLVSDLWPLASQRYHGPCILMTVSEDSPASSNQRILVDALGLTNAEASIALDLAKGNSSAQIAEARNVSVYTVRNQIKSAMSKCSVQRQTQLAVLVHSVLSSQKGLSPSVRRPKM